MNRFKHYFLYSALLILLISTALISTPPIKPGDPAPNFKLYQLKGDSVSLSDFAGKVRVIHLWSHTCPHCRQMNKTLPATVSRYKNTSLVYLMIDIDIDTTGWRNVIREDKLDFAVHLRDPFDGAAKTMIDYNAAGTPCIHIADEKGKLVAVNITEAQLGKFLKKRFPSVK